MLILSRKLNESIIINENIKVTVVAMANNTMTISQTDLIAIVHKAIMHLKLLKKQEGTLPESEQRLMSIAYELELTALSARKVIITR